MEETAMKMNEYMMGREDGLILAYEIVKKVGQMP